MSCIVLFPNIKANHALPHVINQVIPWGLKGFAIAGLFAIIMSTGDSWLNSGGILFSHNVVKPICVRFKVKLNELKIAKFSSLLIGIGAIHIPDQDEFLII